MLKAHTYIGKIVGYAGRLWRAIVHDDGMCRGNMNEKKDTPEHEGKKGKCVFVTVEVTEEDVKRIQQVFDEGKLKHLGIDELIISPIEDSDDKNEAWSHFELRKRDKAQDQDLQLL